MTENRENNSLSIIENVNVQTLQQGVSKIMEFQNLIQSTFTQNHDYGIIPGTSKKPTLLKPGAEKLVMLLGLTSEFEIIDNTRDFEGGFFQYQVKCKLKKHGEIITEGLGTSNTREKKYIKQDPYTMDNTVLKMAKKRALVDAALLVGSLSAIFTQDIEDIDLSGQQASTQQRFYTDRDGTISEAQAKRLFAIANGDKNLIDMVIGKYNYKSSKDVQKTDYNKICDEVQAILAENQQSEVQSK